MSTMSKKFTSSIIENNYFGKIFLRLVALILFLLVLLGKFAINTHIVQSIKQVENTFKLKKSCSCEHNIIRDGIFKT